MPRDLPFEVPDLDLPPPRERRRAVSEEPPSGSIYDGDTLDAVPFLEPCEPAPQAVKEEKEETPRVTHVDQAIFDMAARDKEHTEWLAENDVRPAPIAAALPHPSPSPPGRAAVSGTTRCPTCALPIALHGRQCPHCAAPVVPVTTFLVPPRPLVMSEPVTLGSKITDTLATIPFGVWKRTAGYTFFIAVIGNACTCRGFSLFTNVVCAAVIALSLVGIGACARSQRSP